jgi:hypothetical protein
LVAGIVGFAGAEAADLAGTAVFCATGGTLAFAGTALELFVAGAGAVELFVAGACATATPANIVTSRRLLVSFIPVPYFFFSFLAGAGALV